MSLSCWFVFALLSCIAIFDVQTRVLVNPRMSRDLFLGRPPQLPFALCVAGALTLCIPWSQRGALPRRQAQPGGQTHRFLSGRRKPAAGCGDADGLHCTLLL